jgi:Zn-dependent metalloprotease
MKTLKIAVLILLSLQVLHLNGQELPQFVRSDNAKIKALTKKIDPNGWLEFKKGVKMTPKNLFSDLKDAFGLGANDEMKVQREDIDDKVKMKHIRLQQYVGEYPVEGADFLLHYATNGELLFANGKLCENIKLNSVNLTPDQALAKAMGEFRNSTFAWQDTSWENSLKRENMNPDATYKPNGSLVVTFEQGFELKKDKASLAYKFDLLIVKPNNESYSVYVDAQTGRIVRKKSLVSHASPVSINFTSLYNGNRTTSGERRSFAFFSGTNYLTRNDGNLNITTRKLNGDEIHSNSYNWGTNEQQFTSAHWALERSWIYFRDVRGRKGWMGNGNLAKLRVDVLNQNAAGAARFISGNGGSIEVSKDMMALDIVAHEFTHGMIHQLAGLDSVPFESQSLSESFADIFGEMTQRHTLGSTNWIIGSDVSLSITAHRNLQNPALSTLIQPVTFQGANWDFLGVDNHTNGGVQNRWFNLLSEGSLGVAHNGFTVQGIGSDAAAAITWKSLSTFLTTNSNYQDARNGAILSARILYGCGSNEYLQTIRAWGAVGLPWPLPNPELVGNTYLCQNDPYALPHIEACHFNISSFQWLGIGAIGGVVSGPYNNILDYSSATPGIYNITLRTTFAGMTTDLPFTIEIYNCGGGGPIELQSTKGLLSDKLGAKIYPNPASTYINIDIEAKDFKKLIDVSIVNLLGQTVRQQKINLSNNTINIQGLPNALYNVVLKDDSGIFYRHIKFRKQHNEKKVNNFLICFELLPVGRSSIKY